MVQFIHSKRATFTLAVMHSTVVSHLQYCGVTRTVLWCHTCSTVVSHVQYCVVQYCVVQHGSGEEPPDVLAVAEDALVRLVLHLASQVLVTAFTDTG